ncbi:hypothetical protein [Antarctobacter heliothermus]|uniref:Nitrile hydratase accessory protein n=1 Tax=Antarctobacter heliothermus TaxID=74033 RepID=A0A239M3V9_9RHOB|nr:hypothetical protein [Antarctobacter heliothermus]SNT37517.1 hypothetical protein SAMN04488078_11202 [Antarctobacter heliothermus]
MSVCQESTADFTELWHAQVIAVLDLLVKNKQVDPEKWSRALGAELDQRQSDGATDDDANYYDAFLTALGMMLEKSELASRAEVDERESDWRAAYLGTPHGQPVALKN